MYVIPTYAEFKKGAEKKSLYSNLERTFYAYRMVEPPPMLDMWDSKNRKNKPLVNYGYFDYYIINTMVGIGSKNDHDLIQRVHIRFSFWPKKEGYTAPEVMLIYPSYVSKTVGEISINRNTESQSSYGIEGTARGGNLFRDYN